LSQLRGVTVRDVADSLYIHPFMLSRWRKQAREGSIVTKGIEVEKDVAAELKELRKVKRDYERLKIEQLSLPRRAAASLLFACGRRRSRCRVAGLRWRA
jgi:transposase